MYDPAANTWSTAAAMPIPVTHAATAVYGDTVYVGTFFKGDGIHSSNLILEYHVAENTWSYGPSLPAGRGAGGMGIIGNTLYAWGGLDINRLGHAEMWSLDLTNPSAGWQDAPPLPEELDHFGFASVGGKLYTVGGITDKLENTSNHTTVYVFDPATGQWTQGRAAAPVPGPHRPGHQHRRPLHLRRRRPDQQSRLPADGEQRGAVRHARPTPGRC